MSFILKSLSYQIYENIRFSESFLCDDLIDLIMLKDFLNNNNPDF